MAIQTYNPRQIMIQINGYAVSGLADGTFVSVERTEDAYTLYSGADGRAARVKSNNYSGLLTLTLMQTSDANDELSRYALADQATDAGTFTMMIKDNEGRTLIYSAEAWVQRMPTVEFSKELSNREWTIALSQITYNIGGNTTQS